jgi:hypothetical protein
MKQSFARVEIHIERLVLRGVHLAPEDRTPFERAFEAELAKLMAGGDLSRNLTSPGAIPALGGGTVTKAPKPAEMGRSVAGATWAALSRGHQK